MDSDFKKMNLYNVKYDFVGKIWWLVFGDNICVDALIEN